MDGVGRSNSSNYMHPVGFGYVVIPDSEDRDQYVETCLRKERISIQLDDGGGVIKNCFIAQNILQDVKFPEKEKLGSAVAFIVPKFYNIPIIIGVISRPDETQLLEESSFRKIVSSGNSSINIEGKGKTGELFIDIQSDYEDEGNMFVTLRNKGNTSIFKVECFGDIVMESTGKLNLSSLSDVSLRSVEVDENGDEQMRAQVSFTGNNFRIEDKNGNIIESNDEGEIHIVPSEKLKIFSGGEPLVKGAELKFQLEAMSDRVSRIITALEAGSGASSTAATYSAAVMAVLNTIVTKEDFGNINSEKAFTD